MKGRILRFGFDDLGLTAEGIENIIGYSEGEDREFLLSMIADMLKECRDIADIRAEYRIFPCQGFDKPAHRLILAETSFNVGKIVFSLLNRSESIAIFLCTAGERIGKRSRQLMLEKDLLAGYLFDVAGSEIVEAATDLMQDELQTSAANEGLKITNRYSPGYCGWNVDEQHKLFNLFPGNSCGIKLLPSALMDPEKSVSGFLGIGMNVKKNPYTCRICDMTDCIYRRVSDGRTER